MGIFCTLKCSTFESAKEGSKLGRQANAKISSWSRL